MFKHDEKSWQLTADYNYMDRWILSFSQSLIKFVRAEMAGTFESMLISALRVCLRVPLEVTGNIETSELLGWLHGHFLQRMKSSV